MILPDDSAKWWFGGLFFQGRRTGFFGWAGNQSLDGLITRLAGSVKAGHPVTWIAAAVVFAAGRGDVRRAAGPQRSPDTRARPALAALTGLLVSPVSWDHHWVWIVPGVVVAGHYAVQAWRRGARGGPRPR